MNRSLGELLEQKVNSTLDANMEMLVIIAKLEKRIDELTSKFKELASIMIESKEFDLEQCKYIDELVKYKWDCNHNFIEIEERLKALEGVAKNEL